MASGIVHLSMRWAHHSAHSGYDRISAFMPEATVLGRLPIGAAAPLYRRLFKRFVRPRIGNHPYSADNSLLELNGRRHRIFHRTSLFHYLYGEENFRLLRSTSPRLVATFHHPPRFFAEWGVTGTYLRNLSGVVILGESQRSYFEGFVPPSSIHFVPHGIDTEYFTPASPVRPEGGFRCLTVGSWLRDHETLRATAHAFQSSPGSDRVTFDIVGHPDGKKFYADCPNVTFSSNLSEPELLSLYHRADLAVIPLTDCVANNALLEAMSCRVPVVVTDIGSIRDYANDTCAAFVPPGDPAALHQAISALRAAPSRREQLAGEARRHIARFDWKVVASRMREAYTSILNPLPR